MALQNSQGITEVIRIHLLGTTNFYLVQIHQVYTEIFHWIIEICDLLVVQDDKSENQHQVTKIQPLGTLSRLLVPYLMEIYPMVVEIFQSGNSVAKK